MRYTDEIPLENVPAVCRAMLDAWRPLYERVESRRRHLHNDDSADPKLGREKGGRPDPSDPFAQVSRYQTDRLRQKQVEWVSRVAENHLVIDVEPPDGATGLQKQQAIAIAAAYNDEFRSFEERMVGVGSLQDVVSAIQCAEPFAVLHTRRCEDLWPEYERRVTAELPAGPERASYERRKRRLERECLHCEGEGTIEVQPEYGMGMVEEPCQHCAGSGRMSEQVYRERGDVYEQRVINAYADAGSAWHSEVIDFLQFVPEFDNDPQGGLGRALLHFEVSQAVWRAQGEAGEMDMRRLRAAAKSPGDMHSPNGHETPMSVEDTQRVTVYQLWTRTHCYEWASSDETGVKGWEHGYRGVPFWVVPFFNSGHPDAMWRFECALEGMFRLKEYVDRAFTITAAGVEGQANPLTTQVIDPNTAPLLSDPVGPDGNPVGAADTEAGRIQSMAGETRSLSFPLPQSVPAWLEFIDNQMREAAPETGRAEIKPTSQAWTVRQAMKQANIGPLRAVAYQQMAFQQSLMLRHHWYIDHQKPLIARKRSGDNRRLGGPPIVIEGSELVDYIPYVRIGEESSVERITSVEYTVQLVNAGFGTPEDVYEAQGFEDPVRRALEVAVARVIEPLKQARIAQRVASIMGPEFLMGPNGEFLGPGGQTVPPEAVAAQNGITPGPNNPLSQPAPTMQPTSPIAASVGNQVSMPPLPSLPAGDGMAALPGVRG